MNIGFIPLRMGSKGIPGKNIRKLLGRPLYAWILGEAVKSKLNLIYVYTDSVELNKHIDKEYGSTEKVKTILRSNESATDEASTEFAISEFFKKNDIQFTTLSLLQATSPLVSAADINRSIDLVLTDEFDSSVSVVNSKRFFWNKNGESLNYDYKDRPRRQDFEGAYIENGAVYTISSKQYNISQNRIGGKIGINEMPESTLTEIDEEDDFIIIEKLLSRQLSIFKSHSTKIKVIVLDVDGVFTDGKVVYNNQGEFAKVFNMRDGMGLENIDKNIEIIIMTSENSELVKKRMQKLKLKNVYLGVKDKFLKLENILNEKGLKRSEVAYIGDDVNDLSNIISCGWGICPNDGMDEVKKHADIILNHKGGEMAIRNAISFIQNYNQRFR